MFSLGDGIIIGCAILGVAGVAVKLLQVKRDDKVHHNGGVTRKTVDDLMDNKASIGFCKARHDDLQRQNVRIMNMIDKANERLEVLRDFQLQIPIKGKIIIDKELKDAGDG